MLLEQIRAQLLESMKKRDTSRVDTLRFLLAGIQHAAIAKYGNLSDSSITDADVLDVIKKQVKSHKESVLAFKNAGRSELVIKESKELEILEAYLPKQMTDEELRPSLRPLPLAAKKTLACS